MPEYPLGVRYALANEYGVHHDQININGFTGFDSRPIESPPRYTYSDYEHNRGIRFLNPMGKYYPNVRVAFSLEGSRYVQFVESQLLLPQEIQDLYGYSDHKKGIMLNSYLAAFSFNFPGLRYRLKELWGKELGFLKVAYNRVSSWQELEFGDVISVRFSDIEEKPHFSKFLSQAMTYVSDTLVLSRNGSGPGVPWYLQDIGQVINTEIWRDVFKQYEFFQFWRPKR